MAVVNSLTYLIYSFLTLAANDNPSLRAWQGHSEPDTYNPRHAQQWPIDSHAQQWPIDSHSQQWPIDSHAQQWPIDSHAQQWPIDSHDQQWPDETNTFAQDPYAQQWPDDSQDPYAQQWPDERTTFSPDPYAQQWPDERTTWDPTVTRYAEQDPDFISNHRDYPSRKNQKDFPIPPYIPPASRGKVAPAWPPVKPDWRQGTKRECKDNEQFEICASVCQKTCEDPDQERPCPQNCVPTCICKQGYVRGPEGDCISLDECPQKPAYKSEDRDCKDNEEFEECGSLCPKTCEDPDQERPCPKKCVPTCTCKQGFVRGPDGDCINLDQCPQKPAYKSQVDPDDTWPDKYPDGILRGNGCPEDVTVCWKYCDRQGYSKGSCFGPGSMICNCV